MFIKIITIFPEMFTSIIKYGIINKAINKKLLNIEFFNPRNFSNNKNKIDSKPYGGGEGMVMMCYPIFNIIKTIKENSKNDYYIIYLSPKGKIINNSIINYLYNKKYLILICGRYEGIDNRILNLINNEISIGDYVLSGGEIPAMVLLDLISRNIKGVLNSYNSLVNDSFFNGLLDYPSYTKPKIFINMKVPNILLSGNHKKIFEWRLKQSLGETWLRRPDLIKKKKLTNKEYELLELFKKKYKHK